MGNSGAIVSRANGAGPARCGAAYGASDTSDHLDRLVSVTGPDCSAIFGAWSAGTEANIPGQPRHAPRSIGTPGTWQDWEASVRGVVEERNQEHFTWQSRCEKAQGRW